MYLTVILRPFPACNISENSLLFAYTTLPIIYSETRSCQASAISSCKLQEQGLLCDFATQRRHITSSPNPPACCPSTGLEVYSIGGLYFVELLGLEFRIFKDCCVYATADPLGLTQPTVGLDEIGNL